MSVLSRCRVPDGQGQTVLLRVQLQRASERFLQTRWAAGHRFVRAQDLVAFLPSIPPVTSLSNSPLRRPGSRCMPAFHIEHSPGSRWIVRRTPRCSPHVRPAIKKILDDRCHPNPICDHVKKKRRTDAGSTCTFSYRVWHTFLTPVFAGFNPCGGLATPPASVVRPLTA